ncbi:MAG: prepilin peptidase [Tabrizicola sp.]|jgi:prepilin peptidase CpaA|nr:prepilin peptidase [Tabrizicola sp.]
MITSTGALILLVPVLPIAIWAAVSDMQRMKIPNKSVLAMAAVWPLLGWLAVPTWGAWFWGFAIMAIALVALYLLYTTGTFGAGDAKYGAAISGIFVGTPLTTLLFLIPACMIGALILHRIARGIPAVRSRTPEWLSWEKKGYFPFGLALSAMVVFYLIAAI